MAVPLSFVLSLFFAGRAAAAGERVVLVHAGPTDAVFDAEGAAVPFFGAINQGAQDAAAAMGVALSTKFMGTSVVAGKLVTDFTAAMEEAPDAIVVQMVNPAVKTRIEEALARNITVVAINSGVRLTTGGHATTDPTVLALPRTTQCADVADMYTAACCAHTDAFPSFAAAVPAVPPPTDLLPIAYAGQDDLLAGSAAGARAAREGGVRRVLCLNHESFNGNLVDRCDGYARHVPAMTRPDLDFVQASWSFDASDALWTALLAAVQADAQLDAAVALYPVTCAYMATLIDLHKAGVLTVAPHAAGMHLSCFDAFPDTTWFDNVRSGTIKFFVDQGAYLQSFHGVTMAVQQLRHGISSYAPMFTGPRLVDATNVDAAERAALAAFL